MKFIKTFEIVNLKYKVGDLVKIKIIPDYVKNIENIDDNLFAKIISIDREFTDHYNVNFELLLTNKILYGNEFFIRRKMTKKEIKYIETKKDAKKYNL